LVTATREALEAGVAAAKDGKTNFSITEAIEAVAKKYELTVVNDYGGHGVGEKLHEEPFIANRAADVKGEPFKLTAGMRIAVEPMFSTNSGETYVAKNGWTVKVRSGVTAHFERTIIVP
jgi:methionyl aminopeptidase